MLNSEIQTTDTELFLDRARISTERNLERCLCQPRKHPDNPIVRSEYPWEQMYITVYGSILPKDDGSGFGMWYMAGAKGMQKEQFMCYADSPDGITWHKKLMPLYPYGQCAETNIVHGPETNVHGPCVIRNQHSDDPNEKYLLFYDSYWYNRPELKEHIQDSRWCYTAVSPDGIHWSPNKGRPAVPGKSDIGQSVVWDPEQKLYIAYMRGSRHDGGTVRYVRMATSPDFVNWSEPIELLRADEIDGDPRHQIHQLSVTKRGGQFVGLRSIFHIDRFANQEYEDQGIKNIELGTCDTQLAVSRDGCRWDYCADRAVFLPLGQPGQWDSEWIVTASQIVYHKDQMLFYYASSDRPRGTSKREGIYSIGLATLPRDRFQALRPRAINEEGFLETKPLTFTDGDLTINADAHQGEITAELCDFNGQVIEGFSAAECTAVTRDDQASLIRWNGKRLSDAVDTKDVFGRAIRIRLFLVNASLYAAYWPLVKE